MGSWWEDFPGVHRYLRSWRANRSVGEGNRVRPGWQVSLEETLTLTAGHPTRQNQEQKDNWGDPQPLKQPRKRPPCPPEVQPSGILEVEQILMVGPHHERKVGWTPPASVSTAAMPEQPQAATSCGRMPSTEERR